MNSEVRTAIIDRHESTRDALAVLLKGTPGYRVTGLFSSAEDALKTLDLHPPEVLLLCGGAQDVRPEHIRGIKDRWPVVQILVMANTMNREGIFAAVSAGASGYLLRGTPPARLMYAIRELRDGGAPMSPEVARVIVESLQGPRSEEELPVHLTRREQDTLRLLVEGHSYKTTSARLGVSIDTVRFHVRNIYEKLHVHSKTEAALKAVREGIVDGTGSLDSTASGRHQDRSSSRK